MNQLEIKTQYIAGIYIAPTEQASLKCFKQKKYLK